MKKILYPMLGVVMLSFVVLTCTHNIKQKSETGRLAGRVLNEYNGEPVKNATIAILGEKKRTITDHNGNYFIFNVPIGTYDIEASKSGFKGETIKNIQIGQNATSVANFKLIQGNYKVHYNSYFEPHNDKGKITGRVIDQSTREPIESALIHINHVMCKDALSDSNGEYQLADIQPGIYNVQARTTNIGYWFVRAERIKVEKGKKTIVNFELVWDPILMSSYEVRHEISSECYTAGKIQARVVDKENGEALIFALIRLLDTEKEGTANRFGKFVFDDLAPGLYNIKVMMMGYCPIIAESVKVEVGKITIVDFRLAMQLIWSD